MNKLVFTVAILVLHCLSAMSAVSEPTRFTIKEYVIEGNTLLLDRVIQQWLSPYFGVDCDLNDVKEAVQALRRLYHDSGHLRVEVVIPEQNFKVGKVVLKVIENPASDAKAKSEPEADTASLAVPPPPPPPPPPDFFRKAIAAPAALARLASLSPPKLNAVSTTIVVTGLMSCSEASELETAAFNISLGLACG